MKLVIDIPEKVHNRIRSRYGHCGAIKNGIWSDDLTTVSKAIWNGKVLPRCKDCKHFETDAFATIDGIQISGGNLYWDNSSHEYSPLGCKINYCPFCGVRLRYDKEDSNE